MSFGVRVRDAQGGFFDRAKVMSAIDPATRRVLSGFGAFVRRRARSSIRTRKRISTPGAPPSSHTGLLKQFIYFSFDAASRSVVIGPAKLNKPGDMAVLEHGGDTTLRRRGKSFRAHYEARPFMQPAFDAEIAAGTIERMWRRQAGSA
jgi:hypothetical protein